MLGWTLARLNHTEASTELVACLEELAANPTLPIDQAPKIDQTLSWNYSKWLRSPKRIKLLMRLMSEKFDKRQAGWMTRGVVDICKRIVRNQEMPYETFLRLVVLGSAAPTPQAADLGERLVPVVAANPPQTKAARDASLDYLTTEVRAAASQGQRAVVCARLIGALGKLDAAQRAKLQILATGTTDADVRQYLTEAIRWTEAVETLDRAPGARRLPLLRDFAASRYSVTAAWAIRLLDQDNPPDLVPFLKALWDRDRLSLGGQIAADEILCRRDKLHWARAEARMRVLRTWMRTPYWASFSWTLIASRLESAAGQLGVTFVEHTLGAVDFLDLALLALDNRPEDVEGGVPSWVRKPIRGVAVDGPMQQALFARLTADAEGAEQPARRRWAARLLPLLQPLLEVQRTKLDGLRGATDDPVLAAIVAQVLRDEKSSGVLDRLPPVAKGAEAGPWLTPLRLAGVVAGVALLLGLAFRWAMARDGAVPG